MCGDVYHNSITDDEELAELSHTDLDGHLTYMSSLLLASCFVSCTSLVFGKCHAGA